MDFSATHIDMVITSYVLTSLSLGALIVYVVRRDRNLARKLKDSKND